MRGFALFLCIIGVLITAAGVVVYFQDNKGLGIAGFVLGVGAGSIGVMVFLTDFILRIFRRTASLMVRFQLWLLKLEINGELGAPIDEIGDLEERIEEPLSRWSD